MKKTLTLAFVSFFIILSAFSQDNILTLTANDATPYVTGAKQWRTANTQTTAYTDFLGERIM